MLKYILTTLLLSAFLITNAQSLRGSWVKLHAQTLDGSTLIDYSNLNLLEMDLDIDSEFLCVRYYPLRNKECFKYQRRQNSIRLGEIKWEIIKLTGDSLILKLPHIYNRKSILVTYLNADKFYKDFEISIEDGYVISNSKFSPTFSSNLKTYLFDRIDKSWDGKARGRIKIDFDSQQLKVEWAPHEKSLNLKQITTILERSYPNWENVSSTFNKYIIPFTIQSNKTGKEPKVLFFTDRYESNLDKAFVSQVNAKKAHQLFKEGDQAFQNEEYQNALNLFKRSYELNHTKLKAMYNVAYIYNRLKQTSSACSVWAHLAERGQVKAKQLLEINCIN